MMVLTPPLLGLSMNVEQQLGRHGCGLGVLPLWLLVVSVVVRNVRMVRRSLVRNVTRAIGAIGEVLVLGLLTGDMQKLERRALLLMLNLSAGLRRVPMTQLSGVSVRPQNATLWLTLPMRNARRLSTAPAISFRPPHLTVVRSASLNALL